LNFEIYNKILRILCFATGIEIHNKILRIFLLHAAGCCLLASRHSTELGINTFFHGSDNNKSEEYYYYFR